MGRRDKVFKKSIFILDEAKVDDNDDEDVSMDEDGFTEDFVQEAQEAGRTAREVEAKKRRTASGFDDLEDPEAIEAYFRGRYEEAESPDRFGRGGDEMSEELEQLALLPTAKDPHLWMVRCVPGTEKQTVLKIMRKYMAKVESGENFQLRSVVSLEHIKGIIYLEAFKLAHVTQIIDGIPNLSIGKMVPMNDMTDLLRVIKTQLKKFLGAAPALPSGSDRRPHAFATGDKVLVVKGELINSRGTVLYAQGAKVYVQLKHNDLKDPLELQADELQRYFDHGDHVRVIAGTHEGETGMVVLSRKTMIVMVSDVSMEERKVRSGDLELCSITIQTSIESNGDFKLGDVVHIEPQTVGVITQIQRHHFKILDMNGVSVNRKLAAISKRSADSKNLALDWQKNTIRKGNIVQVIEGLYFGVEGEIRHIFKDFAFLHSLMVKENSGYFVCKCSHLSLARGHVPLRGLNAACWLSNSSSGFVSPYFSPALSLNYGQYGGQGKKRDCLKRDGGSKRKDLIIGETVIVTHGPYKTHVGIVKEADSYTALVELHSVFNSISVERSSIMQVTHSTVGGENEKMNVSSKPMQGFETPFYDAGPTGGETPVRTTTFYHMGEQDMASYDNYPSNQQLFRGDQVEVIQGKFRGKDGTLIIIDDQEGMIQWSDSYEVVFLPLTYYRKIKT